MSSRKVARSVTPITIGIVAFAITNFSSVTGVLHAQRTAQSGPNQRVEGPSGGAKFQVRNGASASPNSGCF